MFNPLSTKTKVKTLNILVRITLFMLMWLLRMPSVDKGLKKNSITFLCLLFSFYPSMTRYLKANNSGKQPTNFQGFLI